MADNFVYGGNPWTVTITNLTVGKRYLTTFYAFGWEGAGARYQTFTNVSGTRCYVDQDLYGSDQGIRISYGFDATASGSTFMITPDGGNTFHMSGLSVAEDPMVQATLSVTNTGASTIVPGSATFSANVQATGSVFDVWVYWGDADGTNNPAAWNGGSNLVTTVTDAASTNVSKTIPGLSPVTVYYTYRIVNAATNYWASPSGSAIVLPTEDDPVITTDPATDVYTNRVTLNALLTSTGTSATAVWVYWGPGGDQYLTGLWAFTNGFGYNTAELPASYATNVTGLLPNTLYTYRYYAVNASTGVWGAAQSFTTWIAPLVDNGAGYAELAPSSVRLNGTVTRGNPTPQAYFCLKAGSVGGETTGSWDRVIAAGTQPGAFSNLLSGLSESTLYYYRAYATNAAGEAWASSAIPFTTPQITYIEMTNSVKSGEILRGLDHGNVPVAVTPTGTGAAADPYTYLTMADPDGVNMVGFKFYGSNEVNRNLKLDLAGSDLVGARSATAFDMKGTAANDYAANLDIQAANNIQIGKVWTYVFRGNGSSARNAGSVTIGTNTTLGRVNKVEISAIDAHAGVDYAASYPGNVSIYGKSDVLIGDGTTSGDIVTYKASNTGGDGGIVEILHQGAFRANNAQTSSSGGNGGAMQINGNVLGTGATGTLLANKLDSTGYGEGASGGAVTIQGYTDITVADGIYSGNEQIYNYAGPGGAISVSGTGDLSLGNLYSYTKGGQGLNRNGGTVNIATTGGGITANNIDAHATALDVYNPSYAGSVTMSASGSIRVLGSIDLDHRAAAANERDLTVTASGESSTITLRSLDMGLVRNAILDAGSGQSYIQGQLSGFAGNGATDLSAGGAGKTIYYTMVSPYNLYLGGLTYTLGAGGANGQLVYTNLLASGAIAWQGAGSGNFEKGANWVGGVAPSNNVATHLATFGAKGGLVDPKLALNRGLSGVSFTDAGWTLSSYVTPYTDYTLTVGQDGVRSAGTGSSTISAKLSLDGTGGEWMIGSGNTLTVSGATSGGGWITKTGLGTLTLSGSSTRTNVTGISAGTLNADNDTALGTGGLVLSGGTVNFRCAAPSVGSLVDGGGTTYGAIVLGGTGDTTLTIGADNATATCSSPIGEASGKVGSLTKIGTGNQTLAGINNFSGALTVSAGTLTLTTNNTFTGVITLNNGGTLTGLAQPSGQGSPFGSTTGTMTLNGTPGTSATGAGNLRLVNTVASARQDVVKGDLTFTGEASIEVAGVNSGRVLLNPNKILRDGGSVLQFPGIARLGLLTDKVKVSDRANSSGLATNTMGFIKPYYIARDGTGYNAAMHAMRYDDANGFAKADDLYTTFALAGADDVVSSGAVDIGNNNYSIWGLRTDACAITRTGTGTLTLNGGFVLGWGYSISVPLILNAETILSCYESTQANITSDISGNFGIVKIGWGALELSTTAKTFVGDVTVLGGVLLADAGGTVGAINGRLGADGNRIVLNGGTLQLHAFKDNDNFLHPITVGSCGGQLQHNHYGGDLNINLTGAISGSGVFRLYPASGSGSFTLNQSSTNSWSGGLYVPGSANSGRAITVAAATSLGSGNVTLEQTTGTLTLTMNGHLNMVATATLFIGANSYVNMTESGQTYEIAALNGTGSVTLGHGSNNGTVTLKIGGSGASVFTGVIRDNAAARNGALIKDGTGMLTLSGANTYTGPTTVSNGTLVVSGSVGNGSVTVSGGSLVVNGTVGNGVVAVDGGSLVVNGTLGTGGVTVKSGATLGGSGTINGAVTNEANGTLTAGASVGTLNVNNNLVMQSGAILAWELGFATNDIVAVTGALTLGDSTTLKLYDAGYAAKLDGEYTLMTYTGTDPALGTWTIDYGATGWSGGKVLLDTVSNPKRVYLKANAAKGTLLMVF